jgi:hypothetical protein
MVGATTKTSPGTAGHALRALATLFLFACAAPPPKSDPLSFLERKNEGSLMSPYRQVRAALIVSETSKRTLEYIHKKNSGVGLGSLNPVNGERLFQQVAEVLQRSFASVAKVSDLQEARSAKVHLATVLDLHLDAPTSNIGKATAEITLVALNPNGQEIDRVSGKATRPVRFFSADSWDSVSQAAVQDALTQLESRLQQSRPLNAFAASLPAIADAPSEKSVPVRGPKRTTSDIDKPAYRLDENPQRFALVIGIDKYASSPEAPFAERDAAAVKDHLLALGCVFRTKSATVSEHPGHHLG